MTTKAEQVGEEIVAQADQGLYPASRELAVRMAASGYLMGLADIAEMIANEGAAYPTQLSEGRMVRIALKRILGEIEIIVNEGASVPGSFRNH
jgi:hypothetical protein